MRIAIVSPYDYFYPGGVGEHVRGLSAALRDRGHEVTVLAPSNVATSGVATPGYVRMGRSVPVPGNGSLAHIGLSVSLGRRVDELLDTACFDVIHYHEPLLPTVPLTVLRRHHGANVGTFHAYAGRSLGYQYGRRFLSRYFRRLHSCIAVSVPACDHVRRYFPGDYHVIPNGVDTTRFAPSRPPHQGLRRSGMFTLLFVGRLDKRKGLETLLAAYEMLRTVRSDVRLVLVGDGPKGAACRRHVARRHIPDVDFRGFVDAAMLPGYYTGADIFCAPATGQESFGIVLLEAMASGVPVVASAIAGFSEIIGNGREGLLLPPGDAAAWSRALAALLDDPARRRRMRAAGVAAAQRYAWQRVTEEILEVYEEARLRERRGLVAACLSALYGCPAGEHPVAGQV
jgi:phosphatidylinositol alpha-mannosyltransferase